MATYFVSSVILVAAFYSLGNESVWLRFVKPLDEGLAMIGRIRPLKGSIERRTQIDSLRLPVVREADIYEGDLLVSGEDSVAEVELAKGLAFTILPESVLRIRTSGDKPLIRLSRGLVKVETSSEQVVLTQVGPLVKEVTIPRGTYFIKNDQAFGIQITSYTQRSMLSAGYQSQKRTRAKAAKPTDLPADATAESSDGTNTGSPTAQHANDDGDAPPPLADRFDLPSPAEGTSFLVRSPREIVVAVRLQCPDHCELRIKKNSEPFLAHDYTRGESTVARIPSSEIQDGDYEWFFNTQNDRHHSHFKVLRFSEANLTKAIEAGTPIEIQ